MVDLEKALNDENEARIRSRLEAAKATGDPDLIAAEEKHLEAIGRLKKKEAAATERAAATTSVTAAPAGRTAQARATTETSVSSSSTKKE
jgi:hypothetical protein